VNETTHDNTEDMLSDTDSAGDSSPKRVIPVSDIDDFEPPVLVYPNGCTRADYRAIGHLRRELTSTGVIPRQKSLKGATKQSMDRLVQIILEANADARSEKDFNSEQYDANAEDALYEMDDDSRSDEHRNPLVDVYDENW
jgi:hypothetical protein